MTGRTFIIDNRVQGKVTVVTDRPLSRSEYFEVFLSSTLRANGLVAVPTAGAASASSRSTAPRASPAASDRRGRRGTSWSPRSSGCARSTRRRRSIPSARW
ncbi:hypothetical protein AB5I41_29175 [Sphingomonas sp. MMS24-JH45]